MSNSNALIWPKACPCCAGDLRYEDDPMWQRLVCCQCARPVSLKGAWKGEQIIDMSRGKGRPRQGHRY